MEIFLKFLFAGLGWLLSKVTFGVLAYRAGQGSVRRRADRDALDARAAQLDAAVAAPKGRKELVDRVRRKGL